MATENPAVQQPTETQKPDVNPTVKATEDPFAGQRAEGENPFNEQNIAGSEDMGLETSQSPTGNRRMSREWDASKVPPSQFQRRKGSIYSTPSSRDGHVHGSGERDKAYFEKLKEKGWNMLKGNK